MKKPSTFDELLNQYILEKSLSEATISSYSSILRRFIKDTEITQLRKVTLSPLLEWRLSVTTRTSDITWNTYLRHMRALWKFAIMKKYVPRTDHFKALNWGKYKKSSKKKTISHQQLTSIMTYLSSQECNLEPCWFWKTLIRFMYFTGVRRKQLATIKWGDLDLNHQTLFLSIEGEKTDISRQLPLQENLIADLKEYRLLVQHHYPRGFHPHSQLFNITLFYDRYLGNEMTEAQVSGFFRRLSNRMEFKVSAHMLRHTMATEMAKTGQIKTLQQILGHSDINTTMNFYVHPDMNQLRGLVNTLNDI
jgi:integrase